MAYMEINEMKQLKEKPILLTGLISVTLTGILLLVAVLMYSSPQAAVKREISHVNECLNMNDTDAALNSVDFLKQAALAGNTESIEELMQLSYLNKDYEGLKNYFGQWTETGAFTSDVFDMQSIINYIEQKDDYNTLKAILGKNDQQAALDYMESIADKYSDNGLDILHKNLFIASAESMFSEQDYEGSIAVLCEALKCFPDDEEVKNELLKVTENEITECIKGQRYMDAINAARICDKAFDYDVLKERRGDIAEAKANDWVLQNYMRDISGFLADNKYDELVEVLTNVRFRRYTQSILEHVFDDGIISDADVSGTGIALYNVDGRAYIYSGTIKNGKRDGEAQWIYYDDEKGLSCYSLNFVDDIPQGEGTYTGKDKLYVMNDKGKVVDKLDVTVSENFIVSGGIIDGKSSVIAIVSGNDCCFEMEQTYNNGFLVAAKESDYPEGLDKYFEHDMPVAGWIKAELYDDYWKENYETTIWYNSTSQLAVIDGIHAILPDAKVSDTVFELVSENRAECYSDDIRFYATADPKQRPVAVAAVSTVNTVPSYIPDVLNPIDRSVYPTAAGVLDSVGWDLKAAYYWSVNTLSYYGHGKPDMPENGSPGTRWFAEFGFSNHKGNCFVFAATFCEMARLLGYPCRQMYGQVPAARGGLTPHSWTEVDINGVTYVFDPEFHHATKKNGFMIGYGTPGTWRYTQYSPMAD